MDAERAARISAWAWALVATAGVIWFAGFSAENAVPLALGSIGLLPIFALADPACRSWLQRSLADSHRGGVLIWILLLGLAGTAAATRHRFNPSFAAVWAIYLALPLAILGTRRGEPDGFRLVLVSLAIGIPFALELVPMPWVCIAGREPVNFGLLVVVDLGLALVFCYRPVTRLGYRFWLSRRELRVAGVGLAAYAVVGLPLGLALGFIRPGLGARTAAEGAGVLLANYFFTAIPEELLFRGMLQNGLERLAGSGWALGVAGLLFGLSHLGNPPAPNWSYALLAAAAGIAYGWVYQRTGSIAASAVTHALVDSTWVLFLAGSLVKPIPPPCP